MGLLEASSALVRSEHGIQHNAQVKLYPDGSAVVSVYDRALMRETGWEARGARPHAGRRAGALCGEEAERDAAATSEESLQRARRRARAAVYDIATATGFDYFVTLTVSPEKLDRYDAATVLRKLNTWLDNQVRRKGLAYVLVPEYHKDGAIHFHALFNSALPVVDSGTLAVPGHDKPRKARSAAQRAEWLARGAHVVYNLPSWRWGWSTAVMLHGDRDAAIGYVCKYISKSDAKIGGRWYYSGGDLLKPDVLAVDLDFEQAAELGEVYEVAEMGCRGVRLRIRKECLDETMGKLSRFA